MAASTSTKRNANTVKSYKESAKHLKSEQHQSPVVLLYYFKDWRRPTSSSFPNPTKEMGLRTKLVVSSCRQEHKKVQLTLLASILVRLSNSTENHSVKCSISHMLEYDLYWNNLNCRTKKL